MSVRHRHILRPVAARSSLSHPAGAIALLLACASPAGADTVSFNYLYNQSDGMFTSDHRAALEYAGELWGKWLDTDTPITMTVRVIWDTDHSSAYATTERTYNSSLAGGVYETDAQLHYREGNSWETIGTVGFGTTPSWYTGLDGASSGNQMDMVTTMLHEIGHLFGMSTSYRGDDDWGFWRITGPKLMHFDTFLVNEDGLTPGTGSGHDYSTAGLEWLGQRGYIMHGYEPIPLVDPENAAQNPSGSPGNLAHPFGTRGLMAYGGRAPTQHGLFAHEIGMFQDLGWNFRYPTTMSLKRWDWSDDAGQRRSNVWLNGANWDWGLPPTSDTDVDFHVPGATDDYALLVLSRAEARHVQMRGSSDAQTQLTVTEGGRLLVERLSVGTGADADALLHITADPAAADTSPGWVNVANWLELGSDGQGTMRLSEGGLVTSWVGDLASSVDGQATLEVRDTASHWILEHNLRIGSSGSAEVDIHQGGRVTSADAAYIALNESGTGIVRVRDPGSSWKAEGIFLATTGASAGGHATVELSNHASAAAGTGTLLVASGATVEVTGHATFSAASLEVRGGYVNAIGGRLAISPLGSGGDPGFYVGIGDGHSQADISAGGHLETGAARVGYLGADVTAAVTVTDAFSRWDVAGSLHVGDMSLGEVNVHQRGLLTSHDASIGATALGTGHVAVVSPASGFRELATVHPSRWLNAGPLHIGQQGSGSLLVDSGGFVHTHELTLAVGDDADGSVTIRGFETSLSSSTFPSRILVDTDTYVGWKGQASLDLEDRGRLHTRAAYVGHTSDSSGTLGLHDGARLAVVSTLGLAWQGDAFVHARQGASVHVGGTTWLAHQPGASASLWMEDEGTTFTGQNTMYIAGSNLEPGGEASVNLFQGTTLDVPAIHLWRHGHLLQWGSAARIQTARLDIIGGRFDQFAGVLDVSSAGSSDEHGMNVGLASGAHGHVRVADDGHLDVRAVHLAPGAGSSATVELTNGAELHSGGALRVGEAGQADMSIQGGATAYTDHAALATTADADAVATVTVAGGRIVPAPGHELTFEPSRLDVLQSLHVAGNADGPGGAALLHVTGNASVDVGQTLRVWHDGTVHVDNARITATDVELIGGTLRGASTVTADLLNHGTFGANLAGRPLNVEGNYTQSEAGRFDVILASDQVSRVAVTGKAHLAGLVNVELADAIPPFWQPMPILTASSIAGNFDMTLLPALPGGFLRLDYQPQQGLLQVGLLGDMNLDGAVDTADVAPFVLALTDEPGYQAQYGIDPVLVGDINQDGSFDTADVAPFVQLLVGGGSPSMPEPGSLALLAMGGLTLLHRRRGQRLW